MSRQWEQSKKGWVTEYNGKELELIRGRAIGYGQYNWTATHGGEPVKWTAPSGNRFDAKDDDIFVATSWKSRVLQYLEPEDTN